MATTKVSALSAKTTPTGNEELLINDGGTSKKITISNSIIAGTGITKSGATISAAPVALTTVQTAANQTAHLALTAQEGDVVVRSDENKTYMHNGGSAGNMNDYTLLATPTDAVTSVNGVTGAVTAAHIATAVEAASDSNVFTDADHSKLNAIEASADVTDATNVTAAGALMDSEVTNLAEVKAFAASDYATAAQGTTANAALPKAGGTMTGNIVMSDDTSIGIADDAERIEFDGAGDISVLGANFGIGTSSPSFFLTAIGGEAGDQATINQTHASYTGSALKIGTVRTANSAYNLLYCATGTAAGGTGGTGEFVVRGDGKVGIGETTPLANLHIKTQDVGTIAVDTAATELLVEGDNPGISIIAADAGDASLVWGSPSDELGVQAKWNHDNNNFRFRTSKAGAGFILGGGDSNSTLTLASTGVATFTNSVITGTDTDTSNTGSITLDFAANQNFVLTLTGNVTLANPSTEQIGQSGFITFIQDGTGSRTVSLGTDYETAGGAGLTLTSTASATDIVPYVVVASGRILLGTPQLAFA